MFALTGWWELCGGHVTLGSIVAYFIARAVYENTRNFWGAVILYYTICLSFGSSATGFGGRTRSLPPTNSPATEVQP